MARLVPKLRLTGHSIAEDIFLTAVYRDVGSIWHLEVICWVVVPYTWWKFTVGLESPMGLPAATEWEGDLAPSPAAVLEER